MGIAIEISWALSAATIFGVSRPVTYHQAIAASVIIARTSSMHRVLLNLVAIFGIFSIARCQDPVSYLLQHSVYSGSGCAETKVIARYVYYLQVCHADPVTKGKKCDLSSSILLPFTFTRAIHFFHLSKPGAHGY